MRATYTRLLDTYHASIPKEDMPNWITPKYEWYVISWGSKDGAQKVKFLRLDYVLRI
jgi:hypothetical protein